MSTQTIPCPEDDEKGIVVENDYLISDELLINYTNLSKKFVTYPFLILILLLAPISILVFTGIEESFGVLRIMLFGGVMVTLSLILGAFQYYIDRKVWPKSIFNVPDENWKKAKSIFYEKFENYQKRGMDLNKLCEHFNRVKNEELNDGTKSLDHAVNTINTMVIGVFMALVAVILGFDQWEKLSADTISKLTISFLSVFVMIITVLLQVRFTYRSFVLSKYDKLNRIHHWMENYLLIKTKMN